MAEKLFTDIKTVIKVNKSKFNKFGGFSYRSLEDIFEAVKPLLTKFGYNLNVSDELCEVGGVPFIKATSILMDADGNVEESVGYAAIDINKKGMDFAQATGAASSYARKYSLNALFLLDDSKDNDSEEHYKMTGRDKKDLTEQQAANFLKTLSSVTKMAEWAQKEFNVFIADGVFMNSENEVKACFYRLLEMKKIDSNGNYNQPRQ